MTKNQFLHSKEAMENFYLKKRKNTSSCDLAGGGWKASKQLPERANHALGCSRIKLVGRKFTKLSGGKKEITLELRTSLMNSNPKGELETAQDSETHQDDPPAFLPFFTRGMTAWVCR